MVTPEDISKILRALQDSINDIVKSTVDDAVREIPWRVQKYLDDVLRNEIRERVRQAIADEVTVVVKVSS